LDVTSNFDVASFFPDDPAATLPDEARRLESFTRKQVDQAWKRLELWRGRSFESGERVQAEATSGLRISDNPFLALDGLGMEKNETALRQQISDLLGRVRFRRAFTPKHPSGGQKYGQNAGSCASQISRRTAVQRN
jgi:hypothetical protein